MSTISVPKLGVGQSFEEWKSLFLAATDLATLTDDQKKNMLPVCIDRTEAEKQIAILGTQEEDLDDALNLIEAYLSLPLYN